MVLLPTYREFNWYKKIIFYQHEYIGYFWCVCREDIEKDTPFKITRKGLIVTHNKPEYGFYRAIELSRKPGQIIKPGCIIPPYLIHIDELKDAIKTTNDEEEKARLELILSTPPTAYETNGYNRPKYLFDVRNQPGERDAVLGGKTYINQRKQPGERDAVLGGKKSRRN